MIADRIRRAMSSLLLCELCSIFLSFSICYFSFYSRLTQSPGILPYHPKNLIFFFIIIFLGSALAACVHFYSELRIFMSYASTSLRSYLRISLIIQLIIGGCGIVCTFFMFSAWAALIFCIYTLIFCAIYSPSALVMRNLLQKLYNSPQHRLNILLVGINRRSARFYNRMRENASLGLHIVGFVDEENTPALHDNEYLGKPEMVEEIIRQHGINLILFFLPMRTYYDTCAKMVNIAESMGVSTHSAGNLFERPRQQVNLIGGLGSMSSAFLHDYNRVSAEHTILRARDILVSTMLILLLWPLALAVALYLFIFNGFPLLSGKEVVGKGMRKFYLYRFRTENASIDAQDGTEAEKPGSADIISRLRLAALPSIINLAKGELSLFGPKALRQEEVEELPQEDQAHYQSVKPGLFKNHN